MNNHFVEGIKEFYNETKNNKDGRYRSWEHCYSAFYNAIKKKDRSNVAKDYLCLQLAFYLASWGMYRGSSFLLQKDYTIHNEIVDLVLNRKYEELLGIECVKLKEKVDLLFELENKIREKYIDKKKEVKENSNNKITDTLITKVLLGTLGCVPAYDRFFINGLKKIKMKNIGFTKKSINELSDYYEKNKVELERARKTMLIKGREYPQMKLIDMGFWMIGKETM